MVVSWMNTLVEQVEFVDMAVFGVAWAALDMKDTLVHVDMVAFERIVLDRVVFVVAWKVAVWPLVQDHNQ